MATNFGICLMSSIPVRRKNTDKSEMVTQLLFGELFEVLETVDDWLNIKTAYDDYEGWVDKKQATFISEQEYQTLQKQSQFICLDLVNTLKIDNEESSPILFGSVFPNLMEDTFKIAHTTYTFSGYSQNFNNQPNRDLLIENALIFLNAPYLWGGRTPFGIDCSGFTQIIYKSVGIKILRDASQQVEQGEKLHLLEEATPGDLLFFGKSEGRISHVGILLPNHRIIHASGKVRIDLIDHYGIYNQDIKDYTHQLRAISTFFPINDE